MKFFAESITLPILRDRGFTSILEVGARYGDNTAMFLTLPDVRVTVIDPCIDHDLQSEFGDRIEIRAGLSLDELPKLNRPFDAIFLDGDHNWYTLFNELRLIEEHNLLNPDGIIFFHDIEWPYGRRDLYYQPEIIPDEFRQPYARRGMQRGKKELLESGGFNDGHDNALIEGGLRNGVLTAIEDHIKASRNNYCLIKDTRQWGLGILFRRTAVNDAVFEKQVRNMIFDICYVAPVREKWRSMVLRMKINPVANFLRTLRNKLLRR
jgi:hypothetical protein